MQHWTRETKSLCLTNLGCRKMREKTHVRKAKKGAVKIVSL